MLRAARIDVLFSPKIVGAIGGKKMTANRSRYCGPPNQYDYMGAMQFCNLFMLGLRAYNSLLDFGCGSLRFGRFAIQYLDAEKYHAIEPQQNLVKEGIALNHLAELIKAKKPKFEFNASCEMSAFGIEFDYIIAQSVLTHMPRKSIEKTFVQAAASMHAGSLFIANHKPGKMDYSGAKWTQDNIAYTPKTVDAMLSAAGLVSTPLHLVHTHLQNWLLIRRKQ